MDLIMVRHGESEDNINPDPKGQDNNAFLTEEGHRQAKSVGEFLAYYKRRGDFDNVWIYTSELERARQTADHIVMLAQQRGQSGKPFAETVDPYFNEVERPGMENWPRNDTLIASWMRAPADYEFAPGSTFRRKRAEMSQWLCENLPRFGENDLVVIVSHGMTIRCMLAEVLGYEDWVINGGLSLRNGECVRLRYTRKGGWSIRIIDPLGPRI